MLRKFKIILLLIVTTLLGVVNLSAAVPEYQIELKNISRQQMEKITRIISVDSFQNGKVEANAIDKELRKLEELGFSYSILPAVTHNVKMSDNLRDLREWDSYPSYESYVEIMYQFATDFPEICSVQSIGTSIQGREILVAKISDNVGSEEAEPASFYSGTIHGDETTGFILLLRLIDYLTQNYGSEDRITNLVNNSEIWINPASNPDGTYAGGNDDINGAVRRNANGVDLNRNYPDFMAGEHPDGEATQPENILMMNFALAHPMVVSANTHGGTEVVNYPWDTTSQRHADDDWWQRVSHNYADAAQAESPNDFMNDYDDGITNGYDWYTISGGRQDWFNYYLRCREFTLEISDEKLLPANELDNHWNYNKESLLGYLEEALYGIRGTVTDDSGNPLAANITVVDHDNNHSDVLSTVDLGDYYRPIEAGTYTLEFSAFGYISQTVENVAITNGNNVIVDASLVQAGISDISGTITDAATNLPLAGASVLLMDSPYAEVFTTTEGSYTIPAIFQDEYQIRIFKEGFTTSLNNITVNENSTQFDFALTISNALSFENGAFGEIWQFSGSQDWFIDNSFAYDGFYSARSGNIGDSQSTTLALELNVAQASTISFYKRVSSEESDNDDYDFFTFSIDGSEIDRWDGMIDWSLEEYNVPAGMHTFAWTYQKDANTSSGEDCAWIDFVTLPIIATSSASQETLPALQLFGNYPNPFNPSGAGRSPSTTISFNLAKNNRTALTIYNIRGQLVKTLVNEQLESGSHAYTWNGTDSSNHQISSGIYFYRLTSGKTSVTRKMILLK